MSERIWGAAPLNDTCWRFGLWAPAARKVALVLDGDELAMHGHDGWWQIDTGAAPGLPYSFRIDGTDRPDPASRAQVDTVDGPSLTVDPRGFDWGATWQGRAFEEAVILEIHVGSFTPEGTFAAAAQRLPGLAALGITMIELMPVSQFHGRWGWGYDGVLNRAPHPAYGTPDEMRAFVRAAQEQGICVILDLVMNHFGPFGNYLPGYAPGFYTDIPTPWGDGIDFERPEVRDFFRQSALGWLEDYRLDGFRLDAVHQIRDGSEQHFMHEMLHEIHAAAWGRPIHLICEDERNLPDLREAGYDAEWNDDWHNVLHVALTGETQGYYKRHGDDPFADLAHALAHGQADEGQPKGAHGARGAPAAHLPWSAFINSNHTHDQIGNRPHGDRLLTLVGDDVGRVIHAALLLMPFTPMLFQGEEEGSEAPFPFFVDPPDDRMRRAVRKGRRKELGALGYDLSKMPDPCGPNAMDMACPYPSPDPARAEAWRALTGELLALRAARITPLLRSGDTGPGEVSRPTPKAFRVRWGFTGGAIEMALCLGTPVGEQLDSADFTLGNTASDAFAIAVRITS
ncbi:malto-oligosyltrehalose trehalohydrolase [Citreicella sp. C3M06]|uniref:malto-oligosyltrehalose trehalohydrolase n=1 Tax=Citreicella sp. C3M06 TaxID=2841564 RepID=UPI001C095A64|nr:malto-oligosyltrehalose trehalohydrolase [Citreicella sp. C3M06]MBU2961058.1 malto-oligosyltrehalose trehalohydrolase [Citreicella sp. C3M06]